MYSTNCYKTYENVKSTILKFSNPCKKNERKRGFGAEKRGTFQWKHGYKYY